MGVLKAGFLVAFAVAEAATVGFVVVICVPSIFYLWVGSSQILNDRPFNIWNASAEREI